MLLLLLYTLFELSSLIALNSSLLSFSFSLSMPVCVCVSVCSRTLASILLVYTLDAVGLHTILSIVIVLLCYSLVFRNNFPCFIVRLIALFIEDSICRKQARIRTNCFPSQSHASKSLYHKSFAFLLFYFNCSSFSSSHAPIFSHKFVFHQHQYNYLYEKLCFMILFTFSLM